MSALVKFGDAIYGKHEGKLLVWDAGWDTFRPVDKIVWNPLRREVQPMYGQLCSELFDTSYGFGDMRDMCIQFTDENVGNLDDAREVGDAEFWEWTGQSTTWFYDRHIVLHPCSKKPSRTEYLSALQVRAKTARQLPRQIRGTLKRRRV